MPEGHTVHRTAELFNDTFGGKKLRVISPQGRFSVGAAKLDGVEFISAWAVGKQMFLNFTKEQTLRIHLGIYGKWNFTGFKVEPPEPVGQVRVRFIAGKNLADLRGPTACDLISLSEALEIAEKLGPDPLNEDADGKQSERFVQNVLASSRSIGLLLMDQNIISGVGNVYRAELLFRAGIDPFQPGRTLQAETLRSIWLDAVKLMRVGVATGIMITRDELLDQHPVKGERYFAYKREGLPCRECGSSIQIALMASRKLYWCSTCQS